MNDTFPPFHDLPPSDPRRQPLSAKLDRLIDSLLPRGEHHDAALHVLVRAVTAIMDSLHSLHRKLDTMSDQLDALGTALAANIQQQQNVLNDLAAHLAAAHPNTANDPRVQGFINQLQNSTSQMSNAHTAYVQSTGDTSAMTTSTDPATGNVTRTTGDSTGTRSASENLGAVSLTSGGVAQNSGQTNPAGPTGTTVTQDGPTGNTGSVTSGGTIVSTPSGTTGSTGDNLGDTGPSGPTGSAR